jgi:antitoxin component HigA of HigAB toxin-antitoxin module
MPMLMMSSELDDEEIHDEREYIAALDQLETLLLSDPDTAAGRRFEALVRMIEEYEARRGGYLLFRRRG